MAKRVYFAFHYQDVIDFRANVVRKHNFTKGVESAGYYDASIWEESEKWGPCSKAANQFGPRAHLSYSGPHWIPDLRSSVGSVQDYEKCGAWQFGTRRAYKHHTGQKIGRQSRWVPSRLIPRILSATMGKKGTQPYGMASNGYSILILTHLTLPSSLLAREIETFSFHTGFEPTTGSGMTDTKLQQLDSLIVPFLLDHIDPTISIWFESLTR